MEEKQLHTNILLLYRFVALGELYTTIVLNKVNRRDTRKSCSPSLFLFGEASD